MSAAAAMAAMHTRLFRNCLDGLDETAARRRVNGQTNNALFLAAHLVDSRAWTARLLGLDIPEPFGGAIAYGTSIEDIPGLPELAQVRDEWSVVSALLEARIAALTPEELAAPGSHRFPIGDPTMAGALAFLLHHEAYHIGQLALLRRVNGLPAMAYR